jgi:hypothetical protein
MITMAQLHISSHCLSGGTRLLGKKVSDRGARRGTCWRSAAFLRHCVAYTCISLAIGAGLFTFIVGFFDGHLGITSAGMLIVPEAMQCLMQRGDTSACSTLHLTDPQIYQKIADATEALSPKSYIYTLAWGGNYLPQTLKAMGLNNV